jgi:hypothetical protein
MGIRAPVDAASGRKYFVWVTHAPARNARRRKFNRPGLLPSTSVSAFRPKRKHPPGLVTWPRSGQVSARPSRAGLLARLTAESRCARLRVCTPPMIRGPRPGISARASRLVLVAHLGIGSKRSKCRSVRGPKHRTTIEEKLIGGERLGRIAPQAEDGTPCTSCRSVARPCGYQNFVWLCMRWRFMADHVDPCRRCGRAGRKAVVALVRRLWSSELPLRR